MRNVASHYYRASIGAAALAVLVVAGPYPGVATAQSVTVDAATLQQLRQLIEAQSQQLEQQAQTIDSLKGRLDQLESASTETQSMASEAQTTAQEAMDTAKEGRTSEAKIVSSGSEKLKLSISGHINRAVNVAGDGEQTKAYFVDNDVSNSRVRFVGTADLTDEGSAGTVVEVTLSPNNSFDVSQ